MHENLKIQLESFVLMLLEQMHLELVEFELQHRNKTLAVHVLLHKDPGGVSVDECITVNKALSQKIEAENLIAGDYVVEVSSPGLDRVLKNEKDFKRVLGREVRFFLNEKIGDKLEQLGKIVEVFDNRVKIDIKTMNIEIPYEKINKAKQELSF